METKQIIGLLGSIVLFIGIFVPLVNIPIIGNITYFLNGEEDSIFILVMVIISFIAVIARGFVGNGYFLFKLMRGQNWIAISKGY